MERQGHEYSSKMELMMKDGLRSKGKVYKCLLGIALLGYCRLYALPHLLPLKLYFLREGPSSPSNAMVRAYRLGTGVLLAVADVVSFTSARVLNRGPQEVG